jgi:hypothetical protein
MDKELGADLADRDRLPSSVLDSEDDSGIVGPYLDLSVGRDVEARTIDPLTPKRHGQRGGCDRYGDWVGHRFGAFVPWAVAQGLSMPRCGAPIALRKYVIDAAAGAKGSPRA